jgi:vanillate/3-O-methylgallate O-demethylase
VFQAPSLQQAIDQAGSPMRLLWKVVPGWQPPMIPDEFVGWREEQRGWLESVSISDQSHHMRDLFVSGPDATKLLADVSANNFASFAVGQAKQFVPVTAEGWMIQDGILLREGDDAYVLTGPSASQNWVLFHAERGDYAVEFFDDPDSRFRPLGRAPRLFRFQVQGPNALALVEQVFGCPLPETKFFHSTPVSLEGRDFRALRHSMGGQPGYEFIGDYRDGDYVKARFLLAGEGFGLVQVGARAYSVNNLESGWIPTPTAGIYTAPELEPYRQWLSSFSFEANNNLHGTWFSEDVDDYYVTPYELGYGRSVSLEHDFIGRDALERARNDEARRVKVTIVPDLEAARTFYGGGFFLSHARNRIEVDGTTIGNTFHTAPIDPLDEILALALVDPSNAAPGTEVTLVLGEHPGPGNDPDADFGYTRVRATVQPAPYSDFARTHYRTAVF